ncbi:dipeptidase [Nocardia farcinica]|uniref:dipeptidase n=1 Tax=Nocardia farcinica TaxID=37329 RepID=UPI001895EA72|nr:dipeptidase [Nocardia farcinica]MBF6271589.1 dipeptidase [Nocardia farcinica]
MSGGQRTVVDPSLMEHASSDLQELVRFASCADPEVGSVEECRLAAEWVRNAFERAGVGDARLIETADNSLTVFGHCPAPAGAPTVLLYTHYDVQPPGELSEWLSDPYELVERNGRWYGRGAADCKGNIVAVLTALRTFGAGSFPVGITVVCEGSEETAAGGLEALVKEQPELFSADAILILDVGNVKAGVPTLTTSLRGIVNVVVRVDTMVRPVHSGMYGGPAPDALAALIAMLSTLRDARGDTTIKGLDCAGRWTGNAYATEAFREDAALLDGVEVLGSGDVADALWSRPSVTVIGIDCPPVSGAVGAVCHTASARLNIRVPPGMTVVEVENALRDHLRSAVPWSAHLDIMTEGVGEPFTSATDGPAYRALIRAMNDAFGGPTVKTGQGGGIPLCTALRAAAPEAEIALLGVEEPLCAIHSPNESVAPGEIKGIAESIAGFLEYFAADVNGSTVTA